MSQKSAPAVIAYENIEVKLGGEKPQEIIELQLIKAINDHARLSFTGIISETVKERFLKNIDTQTPVEVDTVKDGNPLRNLFKGLVTDVEMRSIRDIHYIEIKGISYTYLMDIKVKKRSFQDKEMKYADLVKKVLDDYSGSDFIDQATDGKKTGKFILQYLETDWAFLKRMASHFNAGLVPEAVADKPKFWLGVPEGSDGELEDFHYSVKQRLFDYRESAENYIQGIHEKDFTDYIAESDVCLNIGDNVSFRGQKLKVRQAVMGISKSILKHEYLLSPENGLKQNNLQNHALKGVSLEGKVIEVEKDQVKVHLEIDQEQAKDKAYWFPYSTFYSAEGNTGWFCMPELEDSVKLYFPTAQEEAGVVTTSVRRKGGKGDKISDPHIKYFRTKSGKELMFSEKEIVITGKDGDVLIRLNEDKGIEVFSQQEVKLQAKKDLHIDSGQKVVINAKDTVDIKCKSSSVKMNGETDVKGNLVKTS